MATATPDRNKILPRKHRSYGNYLCLKTSSVKSFPSVVDKDERCNISISLPI
ncbi:hypothetical protein [Pedobacter jejuensis]|uniref:hypothetical protein n=1 Tax=Pedobacter jejuensis TaxID=1268550 RepID=UPI00142D4095|nr:hypothetical protein [Pedobacter jejuensis]